MNKFNNKGFVLVETLIVTAFIMGIITLVYTNYFPLIAEYNVREAYDDIDGKYAAYWIEQFLVSDYFNLCQTGSMSKINENEESNACQKNLSKYSIKSIINNVGYYEFKCKDLNNSEYQNECDRVVEKLEIQNIYITKYVLGGYVKGKDIESNDPNNPNASDKWISKSNAEYVFFKDVVKENNCEVFDTNFQSYVNYLPKYYKRNSTTGSESNGYRVILKMYRTNHNNQGDEDDASRLDDYYAFSEIEVPITCNECASGYCS